MRFSHIDDVPTLQPNNAVASTQLFDWNTQKIETADSK